MAKITRRNFIVGASAGVVVAGAAAAAGFEVGSAQGRAQAKPAGTVKDPIMVYVTDPSKSNVVLLVGTKEITFNDADLVNRLIQAAQ